jgi:hypothetical protein
MSTPDPELPEPAQHSEAADLSMAAVLITAAEFARTQPHQPLQAASPEEVAFLAEHIKPLVECLTRDLSPEQIQNMITGLQAISQAAIVDGLDVQDYLNLMDHLGNIRQTLMCVFRSVDAASKVAHRLYLVDRPQSAPGGEQGGESPPGAPSS